MIDTLKKALGKTNTDYADLRYEIKREVIIAFNGRELTEIGANSTDGYNLRILKNGGLSSVAFTRLADADKAIEKAEENALLISRHIRMPVRFADVPAVKAVYHPVLYEDPRDITIDEKLNITRTYNNIALKHKQIASTTISYAEVTREKYFVSTEGTEICEDLITTRIAGTITSKNGSLLQNVRVGIGGSNGFSKLRNREDEFENKTAIALDLLKAKPVKAGIYNIIINQRLAGLFTHEAFGHFSEADLIEDNPTMKSKMKIGSELGTEVLNIVDDPTLPNQLGFYKYDDEGVEAKPVQLMKNGVLVGRLHSRRTAAGFNESANGHCVAEDYRYAPIVRMGTIFIQAGKETFDTLLQKLDNGLYILDNKGGETSGENFTFGAQYGYAVKNGRVRNMIRDINISGNLYNTLKNINAVADDIMLRETGGCGKAQLNIRSCHGAPHILIRRVIIGGI